MVKWSKSAKNDLKLIYYYIANDSKTYAKKVVNEIVNKSEYLESFPQMGKMVEEVNDPSIREIVVFSYKMIYELVEKHVEILALVHSRREFE